MALRRITLAFITLLLTIILPVSMLLYSMENTMLEPQFWENELETMHAYDGLKASIAENLGGSPAILPDAWMKEQAHSLIVNIIGYSTGEKTALNLTISAKSLKDAWRQEIYLQAEAEVNRQIDAMGYLPEYKEQARAQKQREAKDAIDAQLNAMPENADLAQYMDKKAFDQARGYIITGLAVTKALLVTSILLLLFGLAIAGSLNGAAKWIAPIFILTGISLLLLVLIVPPTIEQATAQANAPEAAKQVVTDVFTAIMAKTTPQGTALTAAGVLLFFYGRKGKQEETKEEKKPEKKDTKPEKKPQEKTSRKKAK